VDYKDAVPQSQPLDERQVANNAGGFSFQARVTSFYCHFGSISCSCRVAMDRSIAASHM
jgi:hypothetical protein